MRASCLIIVACLFSSCLYRAPTEDDLVMIPVTNHPGVTGEKGGDMSPQVNF